MKNDSQQSADTHLTLKDHKNCPKKPVETVKIIKFHQNKLIKPRNDDLRFKDTTYWRSARCCDAAGVSTDFG